MNEEVINTISVVNLLHLIKKEKNIIFYFFSIKSYYLFHFRTYSRMAFTDSTQHC